MTSEQQLDAIMAVMDAAFDPHWREAWTRAQVAGSLGFAHTYAILVAPDGADLANDLHGPAAGFVLARRAPGEEELLLIAVRPEHRGRGLGARLIARFEEIARRGGAERIFLEMRDNNPAEKLYRDQGFAPIGRRKDYYTVSDGSKLDAITFAKPIMAPKASETPG